MQDSNPSGQAAVGVSPARPQRPAKAPAPLAEKVKVGQALALRLFRGQDRKIKTPKLAEKRVQVGKLGMLIRVQTVAVERYRPQPPQFRHGKTPLRDLVERPVLLRECQSKELVAAIRQKIS